MAEHLLILDDDFWTNQRFRYNRVATTDPDANDDATQDADGGYQKGSLWFNTTAVTLWICEDDTIGAAVWSRIDITDHGELTGLTDDDHGQYLKEKASGGLASETPEHDHSAAAEAGTVAHAVTTGQTTDDHHAQTHIHDGLDGSGTVTHAATTGQGTDDHHNQVHAVEGADHTGTVAHSNTSGRTTDDHHAQSHAHDGVDGSGTVAHASVTGQTSDDHHAQAHAIGGADHTGALAHADLSDAPVTAHHDHIATGQVAHANTTGQTTDDHHAQVHAIDGADHTGVLDHDEIANQTTDDHHAQSHGHDGADGSGVVQSWEDIRPGWNGATVEDTSQSISESAGTVYLNFEQSGGGDVTFLFQGVKVDLDCTPIAQVALTAGTDTDPTLNYVYVLEAGGVATLTAGTSWPSAVDYAPIATVLVQSAASVALYGAYKHHAWTDHVQDSNAIGHIGHINAKLRAEAASWISGAAGSALVILNPDAHMTTSAGVIYQLHPHSMPALDMSTDGAYVMNEPTTPNLRITSFDDLSQDAAGGTINNRHFTIVLWGVVSENAGDCRLFINLPTGTYPTQAGAEADSDNYAVYTIPDDYTGTGFLIAAYVVQGKTSGTWVEHQVIDLRGLKPAISPGAGTAVTSHAALSGITADDHHVKYTDAEAVTAIEATADYIDLTDGGETVLHTHAAAGHPDLATHDTLGLQTDAEAATHTADVDAHHAKYTDAEAVTAMGIKGDLNALNHDRYTDAEADARVATHTADPDAHHTWPLTEPDIPAAIARDSEVTADIATHTGIAGAHHSKYLDSEAVTAMGVKGAANPLNHDRYTDAEATTQADASVATHAGLADPHTGYRLESANHSHATSGAQGGQVAHSALSGIGVSDHHVKYTDAEAVTAMGVKGDLNALNHDKYTDAEAIAAVDVAGPIATHAAIAAAHHAKYTDGEAVTAMGVKGDANALNHDKYTDAEVDAIVATHAAASTAHHSRYADSEAIAAIEGEAGLTYPESEANFEPATTRSLHLGSWSGKIWESLVSAWATFRAEVSSATPGMEFYKENTGNTTAIPGNWMMEVDTYAWDGVNWKSGHGLYEEIDAISVGSLTSSLHVRIGTWASVWKWDEVGNFIPTGTVDIGDASNRVDNLFVTTINATNYGLADGDIPASIARDSEVTADIAAHAALGAAHHAKYTDAEAVTAMGVKGDANALNHDRYTDAEADTRADSKVATHAAAADPHTGYVREADANWIDLTDAGETSLHTHPGGGLSDHDHSADTTEGGADLVPGTIVLPGGEIIGSTLPARQLIVQTDASGNVNGNPKLGVNGASSNKSLAYESDITAEIATHAALVNKHSAMKSSNTSGVTMDDFDADGYTLVRFSPNSVATLTGVDAGQVGGQLLVIIVEDNATYPFTFADEDASSTAANRFDLPYGDMAIDADTGEHKIVFVYDDSNNRWRLVTKTPAKAKKVTVYAASLTHTIADGVKSITVQCQAGGGGGGGIVNPGSGKAAGGTGGGGGGWCQKTWTAAELSGATTLTVTVGSGGSGGSSSGGDGGAGGNSSVAGTGLTTCQANGGSGGKGDTTGASGNTTTNARGGGGGSTGFDFDAHGQPSNSWRGINSASATASNGGGSVWGAGGISYINSYGRAGGGYGGGGGAANETNAETTGSNRVGGAGAGGLVVVTEEFAY